jgi:hypothetical protein
MPLIPSDAATLTLQVAAFLQSEPSSPRSAVRWAFVPPPVPSISWGGYTFGEAVDYLNSIAKPIIVGALNHPGAVAVWQPAALGQVERTFAERLLRNQLDGLSEMLSQINNGGEQTILFEGWGSHIGLPVPEFRRWLGEYGLTWGWRLSRPTDDSHCARLLVYQSGLRWSPGDSCTVA